MKRVALVMGAENYHFIPPVKNAHNDARIMVDTLNKAEFDSVKFVPDPKSKNDMIALLKNLALTAGPPEDPAIIFVFFAGHGFQNNEWNYIVPVEARKEQLLTDSLPVSTILRALATHHAGLSIFLFDSCRTALPMTPAGATEDIIGFAALPSTPGAVIGLAAEYGKVARSQAAEGDSNSPYTQALQHFLQIDSRSLAWAFGKVRTHVQILTQGKQTPIKIEGGNDFEFYLRPAKPELDNDRRLWNEVIRSGRTECVEQYIRDRTGSPFLGAALSWLSQSNLPPSNPKEMITCPR